MKILVLQESDWIERGPHQTHHLLERMRQRGHEVRVIDFEVGWPANRQGMLSVRTIYGDQHKVVDDGGVTVIRPSFLRFPVLDYVSVFFSHNLEIRRQIREFRPDIVLGISLMNALSGAIQARRSGLPFVYYLIDEAHRLVPQRALRGLAKVMEQSTMRRSTLVLAINEALREYTVRMGAEPRKTRVLPAGVDLSRYRGAEGGVTVRERHNMPKKAIVLFFMGWLYPFSGLMEVAEAINRSGEDAAKLRLLIVGRGELHDELVSLAEADRSNHRIVIEDWKPYSEMPGYLAAADICLLPAQRNPIMENIVPIKMYEYLAAGKPVIATRLPGLVKEFSDNHGVVYVDNPQDIPTKALELARDGQLGMLGAAGREFVSRNDWQQIVNAFERMLQGLIEPMNGAPASP